MPAVLGRCAADALRRLPLRCAPLRPAAPGLARRCPGAPAWPACHSLASVRFRSGGFPDPRSQETWRHRQALESSDQQVWWIAAGLVAIFGGVWAFVPLYKMYCQAYGQGQAVAGHKEYSAPPTPGSAASKRLITVDFAGTVHDALPWEFKAQQRRVVVGLGETSLAFYRAKNHTDRPIIGVSVYHMIPPEAGLYFNKIQCFCFDEQLLNPNEEVDLPIFFFIDPLMAEDSRFDHIDHITLSYLFFESDSELPPGYEDFQRARPSAQAPPVLDAPKAVATVAGPPAAAPPSAPAASPAAA